MKNTKTIMAATLGLMTLINCDVNAARIIDQMQPNIDNSFTSVIGGSSEQKLAQTFTVSHTGILKGVYLPVSCDSGKLKITLSDVVTGIPGTLEYTSKQVRAIKITNTVDTFRYFNLPGNYPLFAGDELALILENQTGTCGMSQSPIGDSYTAGSGFFDARPNPPGWITLFGPSSPLDLPFILVVKEL